MLEYFDAHIVGLTATPVKQTFGFFQQNLVSEYTYAQSVTDNVNAALHRSAGIGRRALKPPALPADGRSSGGAGASTLERGMG